MFERRRYTTLAAPLYHRIDQLELYQTMLIKTDELPMPAANLRCYYNRSGAHRIFSHVVADGVLVVRVE